jgi:hypothetical protein
MASGWEDGGSSNNSKGLCSSRNIRVLSLHRTGFLTVLFPLPLQPKTEVKLKKFKKNPEVVRKKNVNEMCKKL